ncbi:MAG: polyribonucleotide nucleotidyltransferase [Tenericutes bacterium]|nr:polyribonucleotide nucleotidyltransferase [Mycoplasmatota bacterium]
MKRTFEKEFYGKKIVVEIGELAKQANSACLVRYGDTVVLTAVVNGKEPTTGDFFPLMVLYQEKLYSVGKIPGGFIKREGRPTEAATLAARLIDRPIRPLFKEGFKNEVQIINTVLSVDTAYSPELTALFGSSLALTISDLPFEGPVAGVVVGRINGKFVINPTPEEQEQSDIYLTVAGTKDAINMVESSAKQVSEEDMLEALMFGHEAVKELILFEEEIEKEVGKEKKDYPLIKIDPEINSRVRDIITVRMVNAIKIEEKLARQEKIDELKEETRNTFKELYNNLSEKELEEVIKQVNEVLEHIEYEEIRRLITDDKIRPDGRKTTEIRPLNSQVDILPRTHGSALFTRGQTQVLSVTTLGSINEYQILDGLSDEEGKRFMHHYNFPQFAVGETGRYGTPGRREIGHGALGEKALAQVIPSEEEFPYTIRVVSEVLESNGSSSQASICAGCMSLMAAGVPIKDMVAGIAMGLITNENGNYTILTDIQGAEDHYGDMDFKVAGTKNGICALQMDIKIKGITKEILKEALEQAKVARLEVLENMQTAITEPRKELSKYAPKIKQMKIREDQIKAVIGRGGEVITKIIQDASNVVSVNDKNAVKIDIDDEGRILLYHQDIEVLNKAMKMIEDITREVEEGKIYTAKVVKIIEAGCFVEVWSGCEGFVHISKLAKDRVNKVEDVVKEGDEIVVKYIGTDNKGRLNFSRKDAM